MRKIISIATTAAVAAILLAVVPNLTTSAIHGASPTGTWYLALDATPFGLPGGNLPVLVSFHRHGTFNISDGGDFGGMVKQPFFCNFL